MELGSSDHNTNDDNIEECSSLLEVEMTQDCSVVWDDESNNVDLREFVRSPTSGTLTQCVETPASDEQAKQQQAARKAPLNRIARRLHNDPKTAPEQEIDGILTLLGHENNKGLNKHPNSTDSATPKQTNRRRHSLPAAARGGKTAAVVEAAVANNNNTRKRRKPLQQLGRDDLKKRASLGNISANNNIRNRFLDRRKKSSFFFPKKHVAKTTTTNIADNKDGDFQELLQQVKTPSPMPPKGTSSNKNSDIKTKPCHTKDERHSTLSTNGGNQEKVNPKGGQECLVNNSNHPRHLAHQEGVNLQQTTPENQEKTTLLPQITDSTVHATPNNDGSSPDEFDVGIQFTAEDLAQVDSLIFAATQQESYATQPPHISPLVHKDLSKAKENDPAYGNKQIPQKEQSDSSSQQKNHPPESIKPRNLNKPKTVIDLQDDDDDDNDDDAFGFFPEIDFDALDKDIAHHTQTMSSSNSTMQSPINQSTCSAKENEISFPLFSRYKVKRMEQDLSSYTKKLLVTDWNASMLGESNTKSPHRFSPKNHHCSGEIASNNNSTTGEHSSIVFLRGEWFHTHVVEGDIIHICALTGRESTTELPIVLDTSQQDDLVLIVHPDLLLAPTMVSETIGCSRRAVLRSRIGSTGLSSKAPLFGTMRHNLFERCMTEQNFTIPFAQNQVKKITRDHAESLLGCNISSKEAEREVMKVVPQLQRFAADYTSLVNYNSNQKAPRAMVKGVGHQPSIRFEAQSVEAVEFPVVSPELGLKGNVDVVVHAATEKLQQLTLGPKPTNCSNSMMCIELKTNHQQNVQQAHMAQLAMYILMLQARNGIDLEEQNVSSTTPNDHSAPGSAAPGGMLLYLNGEALNAVHVSPMINEMKSLVGQRNMLATEFMKASRPRGIELSYEKNEGNRINVLPAPPAELPHLLPAGSFLCEKCYANRECMIYAASDTSLPHDKRNDGLLQEFAGHLDEQDFAYFRDWDRLIDLEADAGNTVAAEAWLINSLDREKSTGNCISSLIFSGESSADLEATIDDDSWMTQIGFSRSCDSSVSTPFSCLNFEPGCNVIISTDATSLEVSSVQHRRQRGHRRNRFRHQMHVVRGILEQVTENSVYVRASTAAVRRIRGLISRFNENQANPGVRLKFRLDKDEVATGVGTLRQNLINLFTRDKQRAGEQRPETISLMAKRLPSLRNMIVRLYKPSFDNTLHRYILSPPPSVPKIPGCDIRRLATEFQSLNPDQKVAVEKVMTSKDYTLIQGLPGTGKTSTIAFVARLLAAHGKRVLITSYTHAAVDNLMLKLMEKGLALTNSTVPFPALVRVGRKSSVHSGVRSILVSEIAGREEFAVAFPILRSSQKEDSCLPPSVDSIRKVLKGSRIVGASVLSVPRSSILAGQHFDVVIVDEAGQISQPAILGVLMAADSFVLVGDHKQLPPLVNSEAAEKGGFGISMLKRLADKHSGSIAQLTYQYRMHSDICQLSNDLVYGGALKCANNAVRTTCLKLTGFPNALPRVVSYDSNAWLTRVIDPMLATLFVDTDAMSCKSSGTELESTTGRQVGGNVVNKTESELVRFIVYGLLCAGLSASSVGLICPFRAQLRILNDNPMFRKWKNEGLELSTIDRYQGRDKPVIILSFVRSNKNGKVGRLLSDLRRLNVAMTRAKCKLIMVGSLSTLYRGSDVMKPILDRIKASGRIEKLSNDALHCYNLDQER